MKKTAKARELEKLIWGRLGSDVRISLDVYPARLGWTVQVQDRDLTRGAEFQLKALAIAEELQKLYDLEEE